MKTSKKKGTGMIQWIGIFIGVLGLAYNGYKDYQNGDIKIPQVQQHLTQAKYPVQYCLMAYDPNLNKVFYLHDNGYWYDYAPQQRRYGTATPSQGQVQLQNQNQGSYAVGSATGTQGGTGRYLVR